MLPPTPPPSRDPGVEISEGSWWPLVICMVIVGALLCIAQGAISSSAESAAVWKYRVDVSRELETASLAACVRNGGVPILGERFIGATRIDHLERCDFPRVPR